MRANKKPPVAQGAFTLVETLTALAVFMLIMAMLSGILSQFLDASGRAGSVMSSYDGVRVFSTQITTELGSAMARVNRERWLNLKVERGNAATTAIYFTAPDDNLRSVQAMNFVSHYVYYWKEEEQAFYRAVYNTRTDPRFLKSTASDAENKNTTANQQRLTKMTLAYRSGSAYGWTSSKEIKDIMDQDPDQALLRNVFEFNVRCFKDPKSETSKSEPYWNDPARLPLFIELELLVAEGRMAAGFRQELADNGKLSEKSRSKLRRFVITVPMRNHGINDNRIYQ